MTEVEKFVRAFRWRVLGDPKHHGSHRWAVQVDGWRVSGHDWAMSPDAKRVQAGRWDVSANEKGAEIIGFQSFGAKPPAGIAF